MLPPYGNESNLIGTSGLAFNIHYDPSGIREDTILAYEWNETDWLNLSEIWNVTQNSTSNLVRIEAPTPACVFALFAEQ